MVTWCSVGGLNFFWAGAIALSSTAGDASALAAHAYGSFIALTFNGFFFVFTAHCYRRVEKDSIGTIANRFCVFAECCMLDWDDFRFVLAVTRMGAQRSVRHAEQRARRMEPAACQAGLPSDLARGAVA